MAFFRGTKFPDTFEAIVSEVDITVRTEIDKNGNPVVEGPITVEEDGRAVVLTEALSVAVLAVVISIAFPAALVVTIPIVLADIALTAFTFFGPAPAPDTTVFWKASVPHCSDVGTVDYSISLDGVVVDLDKTTGKLVASPKEITSSISPTFSGRSLMT